MEERILVIIKDRMGTKAIDKSSDREREDRGHHSETAHYKQPFSEELRTAGGRKAPGPAWTDGLRPGRWLRSKPRLERNYTGANCWALTAFSVRICSGNEPQV